MFIYITWKCFFNFLEIQLMFWNMLQNIFRVYFMFIIFHKSPLFIFLIFIIISGIILLKFH